MRATLLAALAVCVMGCSDITGGGKTRMGIRNDSFRTLDEVYIASCASTVWGSNRLNGEVLVAGGQRAWDVSPGCYDIRVVSTTNQTASFSAVHVTKGETNYVSVTNF